MVEWLFDRYEFEIRYKIVFIGVHNTKWEEYRARWLLNLSK